MFWVTVSDGIRLKAWKTNPIRSRLQDRQPPLAELRQLGVPERDGAGGGSVESGRHVQERALPDPDGPMIAGG